MNEYTFLVRSVRDALNAGESQRSLAKLAGVSHATISKLLSGKSEDVSLKTYRTLLDAAQSVVGRNAMQPQTLDATVEQLAAQRVNADLTHHAEWDVDLQCAKYRRVMQLEKELEQSKAEVSVWRKKANTEGLRVSELNMLVQRRDAELSDAADKLEYMKDLSVSDRNNLNVANAEIKRLTALSETHGQSWKAACVQVEQLQKQLDHGQTAYSKLCSQLGATRTKYETQLEAANQKEAQLQEQLTEVYATKTRQDAQVMRLRVYVWGLIAALVFVLVSGLVVWGGV